MNVFQRIVNAARSSLTTFRGPTFATGRTLAKIRVTPDTALKLSTVWACVRVISESIGTLPWHVYRRVGDKRMPYNTHNAAWLLGSQANPETTAFAFREVMLACASVFGNGYAEIERDTSGRPVWLWQIEPWRVRLFRDATTRRLAYRVRNDAGVDDTVIPAEDMFHLHGISFNGIVGMNIVDYADESIALGLAMEQFGSAFFGNSSNPSGVFETDGVMSPDQQAAFREAYAKSQVGTRNTGSALVLPKGMRWKQVSVDPEKSQLTEARLLQVEEVARRFRVPPHKIGHLARSTFSNIEHQSIEFVTDCLLPWCIRLEQESNIKLFGRSQQGIAYTKLDLMGLLRGDSKSQADAFAVGRQWGWWSANDVLRMMDRDPIGLQGDVYLVPANMMNAKHAMKDTAAPRVPGLNEPVTLEDESDNEDSGAAAPAARARAILKIAQHNEGRTQ